MIKAGIRIFLIVVSALLCTVLAWVFLRLKKPFIRDRILRFTARLFLVICGVQVVRKGRQSTGRPLMVVSNHVSYMDIPVLCSQATVRFTPKSEIRDWPFFGWLCDVHGAVFVERKRGKVKKVGNDISTALATGEAVCLFPEASTGNGIRLLPFKSSFFSLAEQEIDGRRLLIQPVAVAYKRIHNLPIGVNQWPDVAWYGDMDLVPHLWNLLKLAPITVHLIYLEPVTAAEIGGRKEIAAYCERVIGEAIEEA